MATIDIYLYAEFIGNPCNFVLIHFLPNMHYPPTLKIKHIIYYTFSVVKHFGRYNWWTLLLMFVGVLSRCYPAIKTYRSTNKVKGAKNRKSPDAARHLFMKQDCFCFFDTSVITAHKLHCCVWQAKIYPEKRVQGFCSAWMDVHTF